MNILIFFIILLVLVLVHEFGHFSVAKKFGIRVDEFGFGFPPKIFGKKFGETEYSLNALPFGGFVKIFGENPDDENTHGPDSGRSFVNKPKYQQALVLFAGVFANFILAWLLFSFGFLSGMPTSVGNENLKDKIRDVSLVVISVLPDSPADKAGLRFGDKIISIGSGENYTEYVSAETIRSFVLGSAGQNIEMQYARGGESNAVSITPEISKIDDKPAIGISMDQVGVAKLPFLSAFWEGMKLTVSMTTNTVVGLYTLILDGITGKGSLASVTGPVGLVGVVGDAYRFGFSYLISFAAVISINLAVINLMPFPALDGGRLFFLLIEKIKGSRIDPKVANAANLVGFGILILLMVAVTFQDVARLF